MWLEKALAVLPEKEAELQVHEKEIAKLEARLKAEQRAKGPHVAELSAELKRLKKLIEDALAETQGRVAGASGAAAKLGIPPSTLDSKIAAFKINKHQFKRI